MSCPHVRRGRVTTAPDGYTGAPHAACSCCDRPGCIAKCKAWAERITGLKAVYVPDSPAVSRRIEQQGRLFR